MRKTSVLLAILFFCLLSFASPEAAFAESYNVILEDFTGYISYKLYGEETEINENFASPTLVERGQTGNEVETIVIQLDYDIYWEMSKNGGAFEIIGNSVVDISLVKNQGRGFHSIVIRPHKVDPEPRFSLSFYIGSELWHGTDAAQGQTAAEPKPPEKDGYIFAGWYEDGATEPYDFSRPVISDITLYAVYTKLNSPSPEIYTVCFYIDDGLISETVIKENQTVARPSDPEKTGYTFIGWFERGGLEQYDFHTEVARDYNLYARFEISKYAVSYYDDGLLLFYSKEYSYGEIIASYDYAPEKPGHAFSHWSLSPSGSPFSFGNPITESFSLYAVFSINRYTACCYDGCAVIGEASVSHGGKPSLPAPPEKTGYAFVGWCLDENLTLIFDTDTPVTEDIKLYAKYEPRTYNITADTGEQITLTVAGSARFGEEVTYSFTAAAGYTVIENAVVSESGNVLDNTGNRFVMPAENVTVRIKMGDKYTLFIKTGDTLTEVTYGGSPSLTPPERVGAVFAGWFLDEALTVEFCGVALGEEGETIILYPKFDIRTYTATFIYGMNLTERHTATVPHNDMPTPPEVPDMEYYIFDGWSEETAPMTSDKTYYALYKRVYDNIYKNGDGIILTVKGEQALTPSVIYTEPQREGHEFRGFIISKIEENAIYYSAVFEPRKYALELVSDDGGELLSYGEPKFGNLITIIPAISDGREILSLTAEGVTLTEAANGIYTFTMPATAVKIILTTKATSYENDAPGGTGPENQLPDNSEEPPGGSDNSQESVISGSEMPALNKLAPLYISVAGVFAGLSAYLGIKTLKIKRIKAKK